VDASGNILEADVITSFTAGVPEASLFTIPASCTSSTPRRMARRNRGEMARRIAQGTSAHARMMNMVKHLFGKK
jgi:hypothetical protein